MMLRRIIEDTDTVAGRLFDLFIQGLIILSLVTFALETLPDLTAEQRRLLYKIETVTVFIFTIEYMLRLVVAKKKFKFMFSFFGLVDLLAVLPFYIASGIDLRSIRLVRLIRIFKLFRYNTAIDRLARVFISIKDELIIFGLITFFLLYIASVGIYYFEHTVQPEEFKSVFHCFWWAVVTITTVGYGDTYPITVGGKIFTSVIIIVGIGVFSVPTGLIASALTSITKKEENEA